MREIEREAARDTYISQIVDDCAGLAIALDMSDPDIRDGLAMAIQATIDNRIGRDDDPFWRAIRRGRERLHFVTPG